MTLIPALALVACVRTQVNDLNPMTLIVKGETVASDIGPDEGLSYTAVAMDPAISFEPRTQSAELFADERSAVTIRSSEPDARFELECQTTIWVWGSMPFEEYLWDEYGDELTQSSQEELIHYAIEKLGDRYDPETETVLVETPLELVASTELTFGEQSALFCYCETNASESQAHLSMTCENIEEF